MIGRNVGTYNLTGKLGEGGMGAVYKGVDLMVEREVAIKVLRPEIAREPEILERFRAEAVALAKLNHPNIATLYSFFREGDEYFMVMEFVAGRTLESILRDTPPMAPGAAIAIATQVLNAIEHAHSHGILHRDIKPANVMLSSSGDVKVTDFGIARVLGKARLTREGCAYGTLEYLAPERIRGQEGDIRSDLYAVGVLLFEMLSHHLPFERTSEFEVMRAHLEEPPPPLASLGLSSIPPRLEMAIHRAMSKSPEERFRSAAEFRSALASTTAERAVVEASTASFDLPGRVPVAATVPAETPVNPEAAPAGRPRWKLYTAAVVMVGVIALVAALVWNRSRPGVTAAPAQPPTQVEAPRTTPPPQPVATAPQVDNSTVAAPETTPRREPQANIQKTPPVRSPGPARSAEATKAKSPADAQAEQAKREAALKALNGGGSAASTATKKTTKDRRAAALDALQK